MYACAFDIPFKLARKAVLSAGKNGSIVRCFFVGK